MVLRRSKFCLKYLLFLSIGSGTTFLLECMKVLEFELKNFRNCVNVSSTVTAEKTLIIGKNGQGKTNILEALYFLSTLKSPRTSNIKEFVNFSSCSFTVRAVILRNEVESTIEITYQLGAKKKLFVNGVKASTKEFRGYLKSVLFSSDDLMLLRGTPADRRSWLDRAITQIYPAYDERLTKYERIRLQKNKLLKEEFINTDLLNIYNEQLAITGANIVHIRKKYLTEISGIAAKKHKSISETESLTISYDYQGEGVEAILANLRNELDTRKQEEIARKQCCVGPHRDDILFCINNNDASKFASQGQQRTLILALKLAELDMLKEKTGEPPILLLDDVLAELDDLRQNFLLKSIQNGIQTILTSVDTLLFDEDFLNTVSLIRVESGRIIDN